MRAFQVVEPGQALEKKELETPTPQGSEVLIKITACGVCHSDLHLQEGGFYLGDGKTLPVPISNRTIGHEIMGVVEAIGDQVVDLNIGDKRVVYPWIGCGRCPICLSGDEQICHQPRALGVNQDGGFSDYVLVPHEKYLFDKGDVPDELAATYACSGLTAYSALKKGGDIGEEDLIIIGAGGVGMMAIQIAISVFNVAPIVIDIDDNKLEEAKSVGAKAVFNSTRKGAAGEILELTRGGAAKAIDFVGAEPTADLGMRCLRKGGVLIVVGLFGGELKTPLPMIPIMERGIQGCYVGNLENMGELMAHVRAGKIPPIPLDVRDMNCCNETLNDLRDGKIVGRAVLKNS